MQLNKLAFGIAVGTMTAMGTLPAVANAADTFTWKMVTSWPKNFPGVGQGPERLARLVDEMSDGRLKIKVYGAGQLVPGFEVLESLHTYPIRYIW